MVCWRRILAKDRRQRNIDKLTVEKSSFLIYPHPSIYFSDMLVKGFIPFPTLVRSKINLSTLKLYNTFLYLQASKQVRQTNIWGRRIRSMMMAMLMVLKLMMS